MIMQSRALLGSALIPVLALTVAAPSAASAATGTATTATTATTAAVPAGLGSWTTPKELPGVTRVIDLESARGGTMAGLFAQDGKTVLSVRPAGSATWQQTEPAAGATLQRTDDGALTLLWWVTAADTEQRTLRMSRLAPDGTAFGPAEDVTTGTLATDWRGVGTPLATVAANAAGRQAVAWMDKDHRLTVVERSGPQGTWSAPTALDRLPDPIVRPDNVYNYTLRDLHLAVATDGTLAALWGGNSYYTGDGVDPDPSAYQWYYKYLEKPAGASSWTAPRDLPQLGEKPQQVTLAAHPKGGFHLLSRGNYARRTAGSADWAPAENIGIATGGELLTAPNGDVTVVGPGTAVATRLASRGTWAGARELTGYAETGSVSAARTANGAVVVTYTQKRFEASRTVRRDFVTQTLAGGSASKPRTLNTLTNATTSTGRVATDDKGRPLAVWTQSADDGSSRTSFTATTGTRSLPKWHEYADTTRSDILGLSRSQALNMFTQDTGNPLVTYQTRSWPTGTRAVAFGDFDGDRCNDVIVRLPGGEARLYTPVCGGLPVPDSAYKRLSQDWSGYDTLLAAGDQTGDGRPDLLARDAATGNIYLYAHNGTDGFKARVKIRSAWTGYKRVIGAGDLNGDGFGDVLALDRSGELWRYNGTGTGTLKDRVRVFSDWGGSYKDVIGAGDLNGDGKNDLVSRDTSDNLWLNAGKGTGTFAGRTQAGTATYWKTWASLA
ncbi:FG-GAP repeat domain-containing protein [Streptomyces sp. SAS_270]|uniref:FG-GAP repeat domain-containing protein n=1 Tax=Streptomyces sp. SAS_270 TaxID=3412748 RepID=UPI00403D29CD